MGDHLAQVVVGQKGLGKIRQVGDVPAVDIGPEKSLLERLVTIVGVVLGVDTIADDKDLHVLEQSAVDPKRMALVAVDLIESLFQFQTPAFEFDLHQGQAVDQKGNVVAVFVDSFHGNLVGDLKKIFTPIFTVVETDVEALTIVAVELKTVVQGFGFFEHVRFGQMVENGVKFFF